MSLPHHTIAEQIEEVRLAQTRAIALRSGQVIKELRPKDQVARSAEVLGSARRTLEWVQANEVFIKAAMATYAKSQEQKETTT